MLYFKNFLSITLGVTLLVFAGMAVYATPTKLKTTTTSAVVVPKDAKKLKKEIEQEPDGSGYSVQPGIIYYNGEKNDKMSINPINAFNNWYNRSFNKQKVIEAQKNWNAILQFITKGQSPLQDTTDLSSFTSLFNQMGGYSILVSTFKGVNFAGVDASRAILTKEGNGLGGDAVVRIYAKKGDSIITLQSTLCSADSEPCKSLQKACTTDIIYLDEDCYSKKLNTDTKVQKAAKAAAQKLVKEFALQ